MVFTSKVHVLYTPSTPHLSLTPFQWADATHGNTAQLSLRDQSPPTMNLLNFYQPPKSPTLEISTTTRYCQTRIISPKYFSKGSLIFPKGHQFSPKCPSPHLLSLLKWDIALNSNIFLKSVFSLANLSFVSFIYRPLNTECKEGGRKDFPHQQTQTKAFF